MMLPPFPFGAPFYRRPFIPHNNNIQNNIKKSPSKSFSDNSKSNESAYFPSKESDLSADNILDNKIQKNNFESRNEEDNFFDFFGLKLYSDDLLLIGLLFFLYQEEVKDTYLYMALIMLLLS